MKVNNSWLITTTTLLSFGALLFAVPFAKADNQNSAQNSGPEPVTNEAEGLALYSANCGGCHQADGGGVPLMQPELIAAPRANDIKGGVIDMVLLGSEAIEPGTSEYSNEMPSFSQLSNKEIALIVTYVRTHFENNGGAVTADDVRNRRTQ